MGISVDITNNSVFSQAIDCIQQHKTLEYPLTNPSVQNRQTLKRIVQEYLKQINLEKSYNLLCLCLEEIISNSVKANIKRAYFLFI